MKIEYRISFLRATPTKDEDRSTQKADDFRWKESITSHLNQLRGVKSAFDQILVVRNGGKLENLHCKFQVCVRCL